MARRPVLGGGTTNPFGGGGVDFGAFNQVNAGQETYLKFLKVQVSWNAGTTSDADYLAAFEVYAAAQDEGTSDAISIKARLEDTRYRIERNVLVNKVTNNEAETSDLVAFDKAHLAGLNVDSEEYRSRQAQYRSSQSAWVNEQEKVVVDQYQNGKMSTTQLRKWYRDIRADPMLSDNPELDQSLKDRIHELDGRVTDEQDAKLISDFNDGKISTPDFLAYATSARARYGAGTTKANEWDDRIKKAKVSGGENSLLYRYNLSQQYAELQRFVAGNSGKSGGGTSTSTSKRTILQPDGTWKTITSTTTKATAPSAASVAAHAKLMIEIADAKRHMAEIAGKVATVGGFVPSSAVLAFYTKQLTGLAKGSQEWYAIQGKIDNVNDRIHAEQVFAKEGIKITYPSGGSGGGASGGSSSHAAATSTGGGTYNAAGSGGGRGGGGISLDQFMRAIASQESGGRYDAHNSSSGAYGKYQIMPANWSNWARQAGLPANAPQTPQNQEKVARAAFEKLAKGYHGDWSRVAGAWFAGVAGEKVGGPGVNRYVNSVMSKLGTTASAVSGGGYTSGASSPGGGGSGSPVVAAGAPHPTAGGRPAGKPTGKGPLAVVTSTTTLHRSGEVQANTRATGFPRNLDSAQFERFYTNYEQAFLAGAESFTDTSSGRPIAYFIGSDVKDKIDRMRQMDDLRVKLYDTKIAAYAGTPTELTAMNQRNNAYKDVAQHEYFIMDLPAPKGGAAPGVPGTATNPIAAAIRILDNQKANIAMNISMAKAAFARGDATAAYALLQMANAELTDIHTQNLVGHTKAAEAQIAAIEAATGGMTPEAALAGKAGVFTADLERLKNAATELTGLFDPESAKVRAEIEANVIVDRNGIPVLDDPASPNGQLQLRPGSYWLLGPGGKVTIEKAPPSFDAQTRTYKYVIPKTVGVKVKTGSSVIDAQAPYELGTVGAFVDAASGKSYDITGKVVRQQDADGNWVTFFENPLAPGTKAGWSNKPYIINAPKGFKAIAGANPGEVAYQFTSDAAKSSGFGRPSATGLEPGWTYTLQADPVTGIYKVFGSHDGTPFGMAPIVDKEIGNAGSLDVASLFADAGFVRDPFGTDGGAFDGTSQPVFGMDASGFDTWSKSATSPSLIDYTKAAYAFKPNAAGQTTDDSGVYRPPAGTYGPAFGKNKAGQTVDDSGVYRPPARQGLPNLPPPISAAAGADNQRRGLPPVPVKDDSGVSRPPSFAPPDKVVAPPPTKHPTTPGTIPGHPATPKPPPNKGKGGAHAPLPPPIKPPPSTGNHGLRPL